MGEWRWFDRTNRHGALYWEGKHPPSGLECYIQMSGYKRGYTSTTFWKAGERGESDRFLRDEPFTDFEEAKRWIESQDPLHVYENLCKPKSSRRNAL